MYHADVNADVNAERGQSKVRQLTLVQMLKC